MGLIPDVRNLAKDASVAAYKFVEKRLLLSDSRIVKWSLEVLEMTYDMADKRRKLLEAKRLKLSLALNHGASPGNMVRCLGDIPARTEVSLVKISDRKWVSIPQGSYVMFLDVVHDENYDIPTLQVLWEERVVYVHHDSKFGKDFSNFERWFEVKSRT